MNDKYGRNEILSYLQENKDRLCSKFSLERIALIGSIARDEYTDGSDVDLIIRFRSGTERIHDLKQQLRQELELVFGRPVQLASEKYLKPYYRQNILKDAMNV